MLISATFTLLYLITPTTPMSLSSSLELSDDTSSWCNILGECRSMFSIVWGCLLTIFACTWIAAHPNVPLDPKESWITAQGRRLKLFVMALIAPEVMVLWSFRQWLSSRRLAERYQDFRWTQTHGFFTIMGGFVECHDGKTKRLCMNFLAEHLEHKENFITEEEINDRSKGDFLSKALVVVQVSWFILQVIGRAVQRLAITELEIATLAFAVLNSVIYFFWWNKPLNVQFPIRIHIKPCSRCELKGITDNQKPPLSDEIKSTIRPDLERGRSPRLSEYSAASSQFHPTESFHKSTSIDTGTNGLGSVPRLPVSAAVTTTTIATDAIVVPNYGARRGCVRLLSFVCKTIISGLRQLLSLLSTVVLELLLLNLVTVPIDFVKLLFFSSYTDPEQENADADQHNIFHCGYISRKDEILVYMLSNGTAVIFGAIHCLAWSFHFPSDPKRDLWRISAIALTVVPILLSMGAAPLQQVYKGNTIGGYNNHPAFLVPLLLLIFTSIVLYISARLILLVEMFLLLRVPQPGIFMAVQWAQFVPHL